MKTCVTCSSDKDELQFEARKDTGKLRGQCHACASVRKLRYRENNAEASLASARETARRRRQELPEQVRKARRDSNRRNRPSIRSYIRGKYKTDPSFRVACSLRSRIRHALLGTVAKQASTQSLLGCPLIWLEIHLGSLFRPGMAWENYGPVWHIDHRRPCASFDLTLPHQQRECFHWTNLQPLFAKENFQKKDSYDAPPRQSSKEVGSRCCQASSR